MSDNGKRKKRDDEPLGQKAVVGQEAGLVDVRVVVSVLGLHRVAVLLKKTVRSRQRCGFSIFFFFFFFFFSLVGRPYEASRTEVSGGQ